MQVFKRASSGSIHGLKKKKKQPTPQPQLKPVILNDTEMLYLQYCQSFAFCCRARLLPKCWGLVSAFWHLRSKREVMLLLSCHLSYNSKPGTQRISNPDLSSDRLTTDCASFLLVFVLIVMYPVTWETVFRGNKRWGRNSHCYALHPTILRHKTKLLGGFRLLS